MIRNILLSIFLLTNIKISYAQDYDQISKEICKSVKENKNFSKGLFDFNKYLNSESEEFLISDANFFYFNLQKSLMKNCSDLPFIENYSLVPSSNVVDLEKVFNREDLAKLKERLKGIQNTNRFQLFVISTEDYFPNENIEEYSFSILNKNSSDLFQNGSLIIVFNLKSKEIRISTNNIARNIITDEFSQKLIDEVIIPKFREEKYFEGIINSVIEINNKISKK
jgi:hypothetical protein